MAITVVFAQVATLKYFSANRGGDAEAYPLELSTAVS